MKRIFNLTSLLIIAYASFLIGCAGTKTSKVDPYIGSWEYVAETEQGSLDVVMTIEKDEEGYKGNLSSYMGAVDLEDLKIEKGQLTAKFYIESYEIPMKGSFEGDIFTGSSSWEGNEMPINATRKASEE